MPKTRLEVPALAIRQAPGRTLFTFGIDGKRLHEFAAVSRVQRNGGEQLAGYQRAEALAHIKTIQRYLESSDPMLPNAVVVAFDKRVRFKPAPGTRRNEPVRPGVLSIPIDPAQPDHKKPGWIVDGQQRTAAIRDADIDSFPISVNAFITDSVEDQRSQFILVNSTKPLPKGLIHELLPATPEKDLPLHLLKRRYPAYLLDRLNYDADSPLQRMIRTPTTTEGTIKDNSILKMLAMSIEDGALYHFYDGNTGQGDAEAMLRVLKAFWAGVKETFPDAWD